MPQRDHEVGADEQVQLAEFDLLDVVEVAGGPEHDEQGVAVAFELRALMGLDRVLDGELMQLELRGERTQFALVGRYNPIQVIPSGLCWAALNVSASVSGDEVRHPPR